jgi:hypothetical protein
MQSLRPEELPGVLGAWGSDLRPVVVDLVGADWADARPLAGMSRFAGIVIGVSNVELPAAAQPYLEAFTLTLAPGGPGRTWVDAPLEPILTSIQENPRAAAALATLLPLTATLDPVQGVVAESLAYSMLLGSPEFAAWRAARPIREATPAEEPVLVSRRGDVLEVTLNRPERRNAFSAQMRDGLLEALNVARLDESIDALLLSGAGPAFCSGGDLDEFGTARDVADAHLTRLRVSAGLAVHELRDRVRPVLHGHCIGAGIEVPAFAGHLSARRGAWFQLPELRMGLVPGAGGTVSLPRRIGRWRTAYLCLSGTAIDVDTALDWGLVDELIG